MFILQNHLFQRCECLLCNLCYIIVIVDALLEVYVMFQMDTVEL